MCLCVCGCACVCVVVLVCVWLCLCVCVLLCMCVYHQVLCAYGREGLICYICFSCPEVIEVSCVQMYVCL